MFANSFTRLFSTRCIFKHPVPKRRPAFAHKHPRPRAARRWRCRAIRYGGSLLLTRRLPRAAFALTSSFISIAYNSTARDMLPRHCQQLARARRCRATSLSDTRPSPTGTPGLAYTSRLCPYPLAERDSLIAPAPVRRRLSEAPCLAHRTITDAACSKSAQGPRVDRGGVFHSVRRRVGETISRSVPRADPMSPKGSQLHKFNHAIASAA
jgi:hypothetical protein